jgi:hypothetical protein
MLLNKPFNLRTLYRLASAALLVFFAIPLLTRHASATWGDTIDAIRGAMLGVTLGLFMLYIIAKRRRPVS